MSHVLYRIGNFAGRHPWRVISTWLLVAAAVFMLNSSIGGQPDESFSLPGAESQRAADAIQDRFPQQTLYSSNVIFHSEDGLTAPATKAAVEQAVDEARRRSARDRGEQPLRPAWTHASARTARRRSPRSASRPRRSAPTTTTPPRRPSRTLRDAGIQVEYDGGLGYANVPAGGNSELIGILMAVLILAIAFGSLVAMSLPIVAALIGHRDRQQRDRHPVRSRAGPEITGVVAMMLGLGVGIDYALFILARHRQNLAAGQTRPRGHRPRQRDRRPVGALRRCHRHRRDPRPEGVRHPDDDDDGLRLGDHGGASRCWPRSRCCPRCSASSSTSVNSARVPFVKPKPAYDPDAKSARWAARVVAKPVRYGGAAALVLGILAVPVFSMHLGFADAGNDAPDSTTRKAYDLMADGYGPGINGPLEVVLDTNGAAISAGDHRRRRRRHWPTSPASPRWTRR